MAEAAIGVQGPFNPDSSTAFPADYPTEGPNCVWTDFLHWKAGAAFACATRAWVEVAA